MGSDLSAEGQILLILEQKQWKDQELMLTKGLLYVTGIL